MELIGVVGPEAGGEGRRRARAPRQAMSVEPTSAIWAGRAMEYASRPLTREEHEANLRRRVVHERGPVEPTMSNRTGTP